MEVIAAAARIELLQSPELFIIAIMCEIQNMALRNSRIIPAWYQYLRFHLIAFIFIRCGLSFVLSLVTQYLQHISQVPGMEYKPHLQTHRLSPIRL